jgi:hypothetical protein
MANTVHLSGYMNRWALPTLRYVILNGAQRSEESLVFQEVRDSSVASGSLRMTRKMTFFHLDTLK